MTKVAEFPLITKYELGKKYQISVVQWSQSDFDCVVLLNQFPNLNSGWNNPEFVENEEVKSPMQVYAFLEEMRHKYREDGKYISMHLTKDLY